MVFFSLKISAAEGYSCTVQICFHLVRIGWGMIPIARLKKMDHDDGRPLLSVRMEACSDWTEFQPKTEYDPEQPALMSENP